MVIKIYPGFENKVVLERNIAKNNVPRGVNFYKILGVDRTASKVQILKAFNKLSVKKHPDKKPGASYEE